MFGRWFSTRTRTQMTVLMTLVTTLVFTPLIHAQESENLKLAETFDLLPAEFELILAVPDMNTFSDRAALLNDALDLKITGLTDLLNEFKRALGMDRGVNGNGSLFLVVQNAESVLPALTVEDGDQPKPGPAPQFIAMIPVSDYAEFVGNFGGSPDELVTALTLPNGQAGYAKVHNSYAIISSQKSQVEGYAPGLTRSALTTLVGQQGFDVLVRSDMSLIIQPKNITDAGYQRAIDLFKSPPDPEAALEPVDEDNVSNSQIMSELYNTAMLRVLKDARTLVIGFGSNEQGMDIHVGMTFKPGSVMGSRLTGDAGAATLLDRLPRREYLYSLDSNMQNVDLKAIIDDMATELQSKGAWYVSLVKNAAPILGQINEVAHVFYAPQGAIGLGTRVMNTAMILKVNDSQRFVSDFQSFLTNANGKSHPMGLMRQGETAETDSRPNVMVLSTFAANALSDDRAQIAQYQLQYTMPMQVLARMNDVSRRMMVLGLNNQEGYIASVDNTTVLLTTVTDAQLVKEMLTILNAPQGAGIAKGAMLAKAMESNLSNTTGQVHVNMLSGMRATHMLIELLLGKQDMDPVFPSDLLPLSLSYKTTNGGLQAKAHLPLETIGYMRGDAQLILAPLFPKPVEGEPGQQPQQMDNRRQDQGMMDPGMMDGPGGREEGGFGNNPRRPRMPTRQGF